MTKILHRTIGTALPSAVAGEGVHINDREGRTCIDGSEGLMCYPMGGTIDGKLGDHVLLAPPFIIVPEQIDMIVDRLATAIRAAIES